MPDAAGWLLTRRSVPSARRDVYSAPAMKLRFEPVRRLCQGAVRDEVAPGFVLLVASEGRVQFHEAFGSRQLLPRQLPTLPDTVYDVASLTKAVVTSVLVGKEIERGVLTLDEPVTKRLPEFDGPGRAGVTIRHLLSHSAGLPAHRPYWQTVAAAASERWAICLAAAREPLDYAPGTLSVYSDLGFILLGWLLERSTEVRLDVLAERDIFHPLGLGASTFVNLSDVEARARLLAEHSVAATQQSPERGRLILGEVDDLNAYAMGGIAGHAGLFSNAADLSAMAAALTAAHKGSNGGSEPGARPIVSRDVIREFWSPAGVPGSTWRLGWDGPAAGPSQAGERLSRRAVGHLAFTGCSLWIDPERETWIVLLANRLHPAVPEHQRFREFRPMIQDAVLEALGYAP
jgi:serine-type D-Ala-D-Ala carboxypeptidase